MLCNTFYKVLSHQMKAKRYIDAYHFYRPQTKWREGNVFTGVCLFTGWRVCLIACSFPGDVGYIWSYMPLGGGIGYPGLRGECMGE